MSNRYSCQAQPSGRASEKHPLTSPNTHAQYDGRYFENHLLSCVRHRDRFSRPGHCETTWVLNQWYNDFMLRTKFRENYLDRCADSMQTFYRKWKRSSLLVQAAHQPESFSPTFPKHKTAILRDNSVQVSR